MQVSPSSARLGAILSLLGGVVVIFSMFFLPMVYGIDYQMDVPVSQWQVLDTFFHAGGPVSAGQVATVLLVLPLLAVPVLFVLVTSAASLFGSLSPALGTWRRRAARAGLVIEVLLGLLVCEIYTFFFTADFFPHFGAGFGLALLGFVVMMVGTARQ